uniref:TNase-like domain-containing protein n=1 Tax=viral metagenome TaxID=1070528 RepID=A0A6C0DG29_9ZZZZ
MAFSIKRYLCFCSFFNNKKKNRERRISVNNLQDADWDNTAPFVPPVTRGKVIKVYDGDTITIASKLPYKSSEIYRFSVRLRGIDSPEIKSKSPVEKELALNSKMCLSNVILGQIVQLKNVSTEKYGRILADVYVDDVSVNKWMLENKFAVPYNGGKKIRSPEWDNDSSSDDE